MDTFDYITFMRKGNVAFITLNRPEKRNPIPNPAKKELLRVFDQCDFDDSIRVVVIRGAGGNFSAGGDLKAMKERLDKGERGTRYNCRLGAEMIWRLRNIKKPTIACVEGAIAGAGLCLAIACDFQIVTENAKMVFAFVNIGYVPDSGATYLVSNAIGTVKTTELFMSGRPFTGKDAAQWGLVTESVSEDKLEEKLNEYIEKYSNGPTKAYGNIKTIINRVQFSNYVVGMQSEIECQGECEQTEDFKEAVYAFFDKRKPKFKGY